MNHPQDDLGEVGKLPRRLILKIASLVDENILTEPNIEKIKDLLKDTAIDLKKIILVFHNMVLFKDNPKEFIKFIDSSSKLTDREKGALKDAMKDIHSRVSTKNIKISEHVRHLTIFGHMHMHPSEDDHSIAPEFRPISEGNKIVKIVPSLVMDVPLYDSRENDKSVNFQMSLEEAEQFAKSLNKGIEFLKAGIADMREKFGSDVI